MKISDFNQRVQAFQKVYKQKKDGELTAILEPGEWFWAKVTPLSFGLKPGRNDEMPGENHYEVVMIKKHNRYTRHACLSQVRCKHKILNIYTPWLDDEKNSCIKGLAIEGTQEEHDG